MTNFAETKALTFDLFGTILDLGGSLTPFIAESLAANPATHIVTPKANRGRGDLAPTNVSPDEFWELWRYRQRIEQYQDTMMMLGHSGYLQTVRRALHYTLQHSGIDPSPDTVETFMRGWQYLSPFPEVLDALDRLKDRYRLVVLSNGDPEFLDYLVTQRVSWDFDDVISVTSVGAFKPHPAVYRGAAGQLGLEVNTCLMVSANSFDVMGARACGYSGAFVNRYSLPYEDTPYQPDVIVPDFTALADALL